MEKKNTLLLTVIALATLLVAVVGATFAYFAVQVENDAEVDITTTTAKASDQFIATGTGSLTIDVTNEKMVKTDANDEEAPESLTDTDSTMTVSLKAGSNSVDCAYTIVYTPAENSAVYSPSKVDGVAYTGKEYTIEGSSDYTKASHVIPETNMDKVTSFGPFTISDVAEDGNAEAQVATVERWTLTARFYNLTIDQRDQLDKTFTGTFKVVVGSCINNGAPANN